ncbi:MAG TPA: proline--tRNA ligase [Dissulfurispiraceae bacterium]|nr:proline--tRNA ligase [Dissulfurispiraceae bacterium]
MKFTQLFIPTTREAPADVTAVSHALLLRAGYVRQLASGLYIFLPLGWRVLNKINTILKDEMERIGAQEISMPILHPAEIWQETGRWFTIKDEMFRLKDRTGRDMCLGMTHEEIMTWVAARELRSYRELPQIWYQIQTKLRDEARPRGGVLRTREFIMKDSYSFDADEEGLDKNYRLHAEAYHRIFKRCGLRFYQVESDAGMMGGAMSHEFMAPTNAGEDVIVVCKTCGYMANTEVAYSTASSVFDERLPFEDVHTPGKRTVREVSAFLKLPSSSFMKSILVMADNSPILVLLRGDYDLHEKKLTKVIGPYRPANKEEIIQYLGVEPGFIGPVGQNRVRIIADNSVRTGSYVSGANKIDYHTTGIRAGEHFDAEWHDLRHVGNGDRCAQCGNHLITEKAIEIGNIFKLGTKYSEPLGAIYLDKEGQEKSMIMGSYGIGPARIAAAAIEQSNDADGIIWPKSIAPFDIEIIPLNVSDFRTMEVAIELYVSLTGIYNSSSKRSFEVLMDDRDLRPGVKFKDADLIGIPLHIVIGERGLRENVIELKTRRTKQSIKVPVENAVREILKVYYEAE